MGDLDICLIKEFARRPGFYDRGDPNFKDKTYTQQSWAEISHQLGYDASLLKDRMYQLRNRYNLEKRRLETLRLEDPKKNVRSPWPLFYHLTFLDRHIRPRRSYKSMMRRPIEADPSGNEDDSLILGERYGRSMRNGTRHTNGNIDVKYEAEVDSDDGQQNGTFLDPSNFLADDGDSIGESSLQNQIANGTTNGHNTRRGMQGRGIHVRSLDSMQRISSNASEDFDQQPPLAKRLCNRNVTATYNSYAPGSGNGIGLIDKFSAFGQFVAASLSDMEEKKALELIGKFTTEVIKALNEKPTPE